MNRLRIGLRLESLGLPLRRALQEAERLGVSGVQMDAVGNLAPDKLGETGRREVRHLLRGCSVELTALGCPLRHGLDVVEDQQPRIDRVRQVMALSFDLGSRLTIVQAGQVPDKTDDPRTARLTEALLDLGRHGDRIGAVLALETGLESGAVLRHFLDRFDTGGLGVNYDPANLLLHGFDPYASARALHDRIVHVHAKDARRASSSRAGQEVPLGHGDLDWMELLGVLEEIGYRSWVTIEREGVAMSVAEAAESVGFLRRFVG